MFETLELDIAAILIASIAGIILHALGIIPEEFVTSLILLLLALHALHGMTHGAKESEVHQKLLEVASKIEEPEIKLIDSKEVFEKGEELAMKNMGEMWWFNTPLGFRNQKIFDAVLKPAIENPRTTRIIFILDEGFRKAWDEEVAPKIEKSAHKEKVQPPIWRKIDRGIAFKMIDLSREKELKEAHLILLEKPFVMKSEKGDARAFYPRYLIQVKSHSKLIQDLKDLFFEYKLKEGI